MCTVGIRETLLLSMNTSRSPLQYADRLVPSNISMLHPLQAKHSAGRISKGKCIRYVLRRRTVQVHMISTAVRLEIRSCLSAPAANRTRHHKEVTMITGIAHINLLVPAGTLDQAEAFYGKTLGLTPRLVPELQRGSLIWYQDPLQPIPSFPTSRHSHLSGST